MRGTAPGHPLSHKINALQDGINVFERIMRRVGRISFKPFVWELGEQYGYL